MPIALDKRMRTVPPALLLTQLAPSFTISTASARYVCATYVWLAWLALSVSPAKRLAKLAIGSAS